MFCKRACVWYGVLSISKVIDMLPVGMYCMYALIREHEAARLHAGK